MPSDHLMKKEVKIKWHLLDLNISEALTATLSKAGYTVETLATTEKLVGLKGIGAKIQNNRHK
jgi:hypothetical protein